MNKWHWARKHLQGESVVQKVVDKMDEAIDEVIEEMVAFGHMRI